jgi:hypothetical protein
MVGLYRRECVADSESYQLTSADLSVLDLVPANLDLRVLAIQHWRFSPCHLFRCIRNPPHSSSTGDSIHPLRALSPSIVFHCTGHLPTLHLIPLLPLYWHTLPPIPPEIPLLLVRPDSCHDCSSGIYLFWKRSSVGPGHRERSDRGIGIAGSVVLETAQG